MSTEEKMEIALLKKDVEVLKEDTEQIKSSLQRMEKALLGDKEYEQEGLVSKVNKMFIFYNSVRINKKFIAKLVGIFGALSGLVYWLAHHIHEILQLFKK